MLIALVSVMSSQPKHFECMCLLKVVPTIQNVLIYSLHRSELQVQPYNVCAVSRCVIAMARFSVIECVVEGRSTLYISCVVLVSSPSLQLCGLSSSAQCQVALRHGICLLLFWTVFD